MKVIHAVSRNIKWTPTGEITLKLKLTALTDYQVSHFFVTCWGFLLRFLSSQSLFLHLSGSHAKHFGLPSSLFQCPSFTNIQVKSKHFRIIWHCNSTINWHILVRMFGTKIICMRCMIYNWHYHSALWDFMNLMHWQKIAGTEKTCCKIEVQKWKRGFSKTKISSSYEPILLSNSAYLITNF